MSAHTPGPWVRFFVDEHTMAILPAGRPGSVADFKAPPSEADAQLIAAAPELLVALEALLVAVAALAARINDGMDLGRDDEPNWAMRLGSEFSKTIDNASNAADAAIAKARGGQ